MSFLDIVAQLGDSMLNSLWIFLLTILFSIPLGLIICIARMYAWKPVQWIMKLYISVVRGTPLMLQLLVIYFGPFFLFCMKLTTEYRFWAVIIAFSLNYAAYFSEIFRGGIETIPKGQHEAGQVLGMTKSQIFFKVTLLQVIKRIVPPMGNEIITLVKDTSLARIISCKEIIMMAQEYTAKGLIWPLFSTGLFFLAFVGALTLLLGYLERKMDYFRV